MKTNTQPTERVSYSSLLDTVEVFDIWDTIQGEGPFAGLPAIFVRLAGCNLMCPMCDTDYTSKRTIMTPYEVLLSVQHLSQHHRIVVITGGEPFRQPIGPMVRGLRKRSYRVQIETNGTLYQSDFPYDDDGVVIVCSPKTAQINKQLTPHIDCYKYVVTAGMVCEDDGLPLSALDMASKPARPPADHLADIYVQPMDEQDEDRNKAHLAETINSCRKFGYQLCLQLHKIIGMP